MSKYETNVVQAKRIGDRLPSIWTAFCASITGKSKKEEFYVLLSKRTIENNAESAPYLALFSHPTNDANASGPVSSPAVTVNMASITREIGEKMKKVVSVNKTTSVHNEETGLFSTDNRSVVVAVMDCGKEKTLPSLKAEGIADQFVWIPLKRLDKGIKRSPAKTELSYVNPPKESPFSITAEKTSFLLSAATVFSLQKVCEHYGVPCTQRISSQDIENARTIRNARKPQKRVVDITEQGEYTKIRRRNLSSPPKPSTMQIS